MPDSERAVEPGNCTGSSGRGDSVRCCCRRSTSKRVASSGVSAAICSEGSLENGAACPVTLSRTAASVRACSLATTESNLGQRRVRAPLHLATGTTRCDIHPDARLGARVLQRRGPRTRQTRMEADVDRSAKIIRLAWASLLSSEGCGIWSRDDMAPSLGVDFQRRGRA